MVFLMFFDKDFYLLTYWTSKYIKFSMLFMVKTARFLKLFVRAQSSKLCFENFEMFRYILAF